MHSRIGLAILKLNYYLPNFQVVGDLICNEMNSLIVLYNNWSNIFRGQDPESKHFAGDLYPAIAFIGLSYLRITLASVIMDRWEKQGDHVLMCVHTVQLDCVCFTESKWMRKKLKKSQSTIRSIIHTCV